MYIFYCPTITKNCKCTNEQFNNENVRNDNYSYGYLTYLFDANFNSLEDFIKQHIEKSTHINEKYRNIILYNRMETLTPQISKNIFL